jgi:hypothetical protein
MNRTDVPITNACQADWTTMTLAERGRFCGACRKVVRELAQLTEGEARALLTAPPSEGLCVRYIHDERGEIVFRRDVIPVARLGRKAVALAMAMALPMSAAACTSEVLTGPPATPPPRLEATMGAPPVPDVTPAQNIPTPDGGSPPARP